MKSVGGRLCLDLNGYGVGYNCRGGMIQRPGRFMVSWLEFVLVLLTGVQRR